MTRERYEIEFQGSRDGQTWTPYPFRNKPQDVHAPPRIYAPYQPRFDWNLWFASLGSWRQYPWVLNVEERLLSGEPDVLALFAEDPFPGHPPEQIRVVLWQYWFTDWTRKAGTGPLVAARADWTVRALPWSARQTVKLPSWRCRTRFRIHSNSILFNSI